MVDVLELAPGPHADLYGDGMEPPSFEVFHEPEIINAPVVPTRDPFEELSKQTAFALTECMERRSFAIHELIMQRLFRRTKAFKLRVLEILTETRCDRHLLLLAQQVAAC